MAWSIFGSVMIVCLTLLALRGCANTGELASKCLEKGWVMQGQFCVPVGGEK